MTCRSAGGCPGRVTEEYGTGDVEREAGSQEDQHGRIYILRSAARDRDDPSGRTVADGQGAAPDRRPAAPDRKGRVTG